ncbi:MAG: phosphoribosylanthranilate isomerase [Candidatus Omnitrophota bacterium]
MVKVKICGITNLEDAFNSIEAGYDALGFIFYKKSPRYITPQKASQIIRHLPSDILKIGVFVNAQEKTIRRTAELCNLDMLQFHGDESPEFCARFKGYKIIKAFRLKNRIDTANILNYRTFAYLFDTFVKAKVGGTGKKFNWALLRHLGSFHKPVFLSGGLDAQNVLEAIEKVRPEWVDVSSSVEISPGKKDSKKVREFIKTVKNSAF